MLEVPFVILLSDATGVIICCVFEKICYGVRIVMEPSPGAESWSISRVRCYFIFTSNLIHRKTSFPYIEELCFLQNP